MTEVVVEAVLAVGVVVSVTEEAPVVKAAIEVTTFPHTMLVWQEPQNIEALSLNQAD